MMNIPRKLFSLQSRSLKNRRTFASGASADRANSKFIYKSQLSGIVVPNKSFAESYWRDSAAFKNHVAVECAETHKSYTYGVLQRHAAAFTTSLYKKLNLKKGDIVAVMLPNCPEFTVVTFGLFQSGFPMTTINPVYKEYEVTHHFKTTGPKVVVTSPECYKVVQNSLKSAKIEAKIIVIDKPNEPIPDGAIRFSEVAENSEPDYDLISKITVNKDDVLCIPFSSGTTALPKGVDLTLGNILAGVEMMRHEKICFPQLPTDTFQDVVPCVLPFFHVYGMVPVMLGHMNKGAKLVTVSKFSASLFFEVLKDYKSTLLYVVPPLVSLLSKHPDVTYEHLRHLRHICCGAAPMAESDVIPLVEKSKGKIKIGQGFGATETMALTTGTPIGHKIDLSAAGEPMSNVELMFVNPETGKPVPIGEEGEVYVRSLTVMKGYHRNEAATKDSITDDGFFKTGDLGYYKTGKGLFINDRIKELIKVKGMQVAPAELESLLRSHPSVADAAVIGVPHEYNGEAPKAFIIPKNGVKLTTEEVQEFVASKVAPFKKIEQVMFVKEIPKTASGKIMRKDLKKMYA